MCNRNRTTGNKTRQQLHKTTGQLVEAARCGDCGFETGQKTTPPPGAGEGVAVRLIRVQPTLILRQSSRQCKLYHPKCPCLIFARLADVFKAGG